MSKDQPRLRRSSPSTTSVRLGTTYSERQVRSAPEVKRPTKKLQTVTSAALKLVVFSAVALTIVSVLRLDMSSIVFANDDGQLRKREYQEYADRLLRSNLLNSTKLTIQRSSIEDKMTAEFPEIDSVTVSVDLLGRKPAIDVSASPITAVIEGRGGRYALAGNGMLAYETAVNANVIVVKDESGIELAKGQRFMRSDDSEFLRVLSEVFATNKREVEYVKLTTIPRELLVKDTAKPYEVKMYFEEDPYDQLGSLFAVEKMLGEGGVTPTKYIDVRISEKVFWL